MGICLGSRTGKGNVLSKFDSIACNSPTDSRHGTEYTVCSGSLRQWTHYDIFSSGQMRSFTGVAQSFIPKQPILVHAVHYAGLHVPFHICLTLAPGSSIGFDPISPNTVVRTCISPGLVMGSKSQYTRSGKESGTKGRT